MNITQELAIVALVWAIGGAVGQLLLIPFGADNWTLWFGLVLGAVGQTLVLHERKKLESR